MSDLVKIARARVTDIQQTHWEGCERDHRECLIQRMADEIERLTKSEQIEAQIEARDALLDFISENGTASEGVQHYLDRYVRAALAAKDAT